jgi:hypothetical protein
MTPNANVQLLASLKEKVEGLESDVAGFEKMIEEIRATGRIEAMEDLMTNLLGDLVCCTWHLCVHVCSS